MCNIKKRKAPLSTQRVYKGKPMKIQNKTRYNPKETLQTRNPKKIQGTQPNTLTRETLVYLKGNPSAPQGGKENAFFDPKQPRRRWPFTKEIEQSRFLSSLNPLTLGTATFWRESSIFHPHRLVSEYKRLKKEMTKFTSQSYICLIKDIFHYKTPLKTCIWYATHASLHYAILNSSKKVTFKGWSPHHKSCQNLILDPSFTYQKLILDPSPT